MKKIIHIEKKLQNFTVIFSIANFLRNFAHFLLKKFALCKKNLRKNKRKTFQSPYSLKSNLVRPKSNYVRLIFSMYGASSEHIPRRSKCQRATRHTCLCPYAVFVYLCFCEFVFLYLCICICVFAHQILGNIIYHLFSKI